jgi:DNA-directed RNA polymerase specialized sigma24 family protein
MNKLSVKKAEQKKDWSLTENAFHRLLNWLDEGTTSNGERYLEMRRRLVDYFDRKNCLSPEDLTDETMNRVARRLEEEGIIESDTPAKYCYIVARFVFMEYLRRTQKEDGTLEEVAWQPAIISLPAYEADDERTRKESMLNCLEECVAKLDPINKEIITGYYTGTERIKIENRRALAERLGITMNALSIRACRIRDRLEECVKRCISSR